jgi:ankyrin repeat protein
MLKKPSFAANIVTGQAAIAACDLSVRGCVTQRVPTAFVAMITMLPIRDVAPTAAEVAASSEDRILADWIRYINIVPVNLRTIDFDAIVFNATRYEALVAALEQAPWHAYLKRLRLRVDPEVNTFTVQKVEPLAAALGGCRQLQYLHVEHASFFVWTSLFASSAVRPARTVLPRRVVINGISLTRLAMAAALGFEHAVTTMLRTTPEKRGVNVNEPMNGGATALHFAAFHDRVEMCKLLLRHNVNPNAADSFGWTAVILSAYCGKTPILDALLAAGCDAEAQQQEGWTALMLAVHRGHLAAAGYLLKAGASMKPTTADGRGLLMIAAAPAVESASMAQMLEAIIGAGCDLEQRDLQGFTPFMSAAYFDNATAVATLLKAGCNKEAVNQLGWTSLMCAAYNGNASMVATLHDAGCKLLARDLIGRTSLMVAAMAGHSNVVQLLLDRDTRGHLKRMQDANGGLPWQYVLNKDTDLIRMLK